jgi:hypothetical protein
MPDGAMLYRRDDSSPVVRLTVAEFRQIGVLNGHILTAVLLTLIVIAIFDGYWITGDIGNVVAGLGLVALLDANIFWYIRCRKKKDDVLSQAEISAEPLEIEPREGFAARLRIRDATYHMAFEKWSTFQAMAGGLVGGIFVAGST